MLAKQIKFQIHGDKRGQLIVLEDDKNMPFNIKRVFYMYDTEEGVTRGKHAHKTLKQVLICISGSCKILFDDGKTKETIELNDPSVGVYVPPHLWHEMFDFSKGAVLMSLASDLYDENDYIRDYDDFLKYASTLEGK